MVVILGYICVFWGGGGGDNDGGDQNRSGRDLGTF